METNESELPMRCRNRRDDVETGGRLPTGNSLGEYLKSRMDGVRHRGSVTVVQACVWNVGTCRPDDKGELQVRSLHKDKSTDAGHRGGAARSSEEASVMDVKRRGCIDPVVSTRQPVMGGAR
jgi:hypothetical protein